MDIYEDSRTVSRSDLAAWLRQMADQIDSGQVFYGAGGAISVADHVECELEIEQEDENEFSVEIEFTWVNPSADSDDDEDDESDEDDE